MLLSPIKIEDSTQSPMVCFNIQPMLEPIVRASSSILGMVESFSAKRDLPRTSWQEKSPDLSLNLPQAPAIFTHWSAASTAIIRFIFDDTAPSGIMALWNFIPRNFSSIQKFFSHFPLNSSGTGSSQPSVCSTAALISALRMDIIGAIFPVRSKIE